MGGDCLKHRIHARDALSSRAKAIRGDPQDATLGPLFQINCWDLPGKKKENNTIPEYICQ